jgi:hypothetical protein
MRSLSNAGVRQQLLERLEKLTPETRPLWGRMSAPQMVAHLVDWMLMLKGDLKTARIKNPMRYPPLKQFAIYWMPWPKGVPTARELLPGRPVEWGPELDLLRQYLQSYPELESRARWPEHPAFGAMTTREWGVFAYRHTDHHFRQFGL